MTILEAIRAVMRDAGRPMSAKDALDQIRARNLYEFKAKDPSALVQREIRRHCEGLQLKTAAEVKYFQLVDGDRYRIFGQP